MRWHTLWLAFPAVLIAADVAAARSLAQIRQDIATTAKQLEAKQRQLRGEQASLQILQEKKKNIEILRRKYVHYREPLVGPTRNLEKTLKEYVDDFKRAAWWSLDDDGRARSVWALTRVPESPEEAGWEGWKKWLLDAVHFDPVEDVLLEASKDLSKAEAQLRKARIAYQDARDSVDRAIRQDPSFREAGWLNCRKFDQLADLYLKEGSRLRDEIEPAIRQLEKVTIPRIEKEVKALTARLSELKAEERVAMRRPAKVQHQIREATHTRRGDQVTWRFVIAFIERSGVPVTLTLVDRTREPLGLQDKATEVPLVAKIDYERPPLGTATVGPEYLVVSGHNGYKGRYQARFKATDKHGNTFDYTVDWVPPKPPALSRITVVEPDARRLAEGTRAWQERFVVKVPDLPPGRYRMTVATNKGQRFYLWATVSQGEKGAEFVGHLPVPLGQFSMTFSLLEAHGIEPATFAGIRRLQDGRTLQQALAAADKAIKKDLDTARLYHNQRILLESAAGGLTKKANIYAEYGDYDRAKTHAEKALAAYQQAGHKRTDWIMLPALQTLEWCAYGTGDVQGCYQAKTGRVQVYLAKAAEAESKDDQSDIKRYRSAAAEEYLALAETWLKMGGRADEVRGTYEAGVRLLRQAGESDARVRSRVADLHSLAAVFLKSRNQSGCPRRPGLSAR